MTLLSFASRRFRAKRKRDIIKKDIADCSLDRGPVVTRIKFLSSRLAVKLDRC